MPQNKSGAGTRTWSLGNALNKSGTRVHQKVDREIVKAKKPFKIKKNAKPTPTKQKALEANVKAVDQLTAEADQISEAENELKEQRLEEEV